MDVTIETPKGSMMKYKFDHHLKQYRLLKALPKGLMFPFDFGYIPGTRGEEDEPLDIMVLSEFSTFPGCVVSCRLIGCLQVIQEKNGVKFRNDRFLAVCRQSRAYENITSIEQVPPKMIHDVKNFFVNYLRAEGYEVEITAALNPQDAFHILYNQVE